MRLETKHIFGAYSGESWSSIGGWRKSRESYIFSITDGKGRDPFISRLDKTDPKNQLRALYFSDKYGLVFGTKDFTINFDDLSKS